MAETTGGYTTPTRAARKPIALAAGNAAEGAAQAAYRAYVEHRPTCGDCREGDALQCPAADALWEAYRQARAPR